MDGKGLKDLQILKNYPLEPDKYSQHALYHKMLLLLCSLNERALGTKIKESQLFQNGHSKVCLSAEVFYHNLVFVLKLRIEDTSKIAEKMDQEKFYAMEERE